MRAEAGGGRGAAGPRGCAPPGQGWVLGAAGGVLLPGGCSMTQPCLSSPCLFGFGGDAGDPSRVILGSKLLADMSNLAVSKKAS